MPRPTSGREVRARMRRQRGLTVLVWTLAAAALGALAPVAPGGVLLVDRALGALFAGTTAYAGRRARRWALFIPGAVGGSLAGSGLGLALALVAIAIASLNGWRRQRSSRLGVASAGLGAASLLHMGDLGVQGASAIVAGVAAAFVLVSAWHNARRRERRVARIVVAGLAAAAAVLVVAGGFAALVARQDLDDGRGALQRGVAAARSGDLPAAADHLREAAERFRTADQRMDSWWALPARALPVAGHNFRAVAAAADLATAVTTSGAETVASADAADLETQNGRVPIESIAALDPVVRRTLETVLSAQRRVEQNESEWLVGPVGDAYRDIATELADVRPDLEVALDAVNRLPSLLGDGGARRYFVLFVSPVEGRATGFPGNYAEIVVEDGRMDMPVFGRVTDLNFASDPSTRSVDMPAEFHGRYDRTIPAADLRNITASPDFPTVAELVRQLYPQVGGAPIDGVLSVDPAAVAALLELTGPITVPGIPEPMTARNAEDYILRGQYEVFDEQGDERVDALETLGRRTFERLTTGSLPGPSAVADVLAPIADVGHLRMVSFVPDDQVFLDQVGMTGGLPPVISDSLGVTTNNAISGKIDLYLERDFDYEVAWDPATGEVDATLEVTLRNHAPASGLPDYVVVNALPDPEGQALPRGSNRTFVSVFTPLLLEGATLDGEPVVLETQTEKGRLVYSTFVDLLPGGDEAVLTLDLSGLVGGQYRLDTFTQLLPIPDDLAFRLTATEPLTAGTGAEIVVDGGAASAEMTLDAPRSLTVLPRSRSDG